MLSDILRENTDRWIAKKRKERMDKARSEGRAKVQKLWEDWNQRRLAHKTRGEPFGELPPSLD